MCAITGSGEHGLRRHQAAKATATSNKFSSADNYKTRVISLLEKAEVPKDCTVLLVGGPRFDLVSPGSQRDQDLRG